MSDGSASMARPVLITGAAGFIGAALALRLLERGQRVVGIDNLNTYYDNSSIADLSMADPLFLPHSGTSFVWPLLYSSCSN